MPYLYMFLIQCKIQMICCINSQKLITVYVFLHFLQTEIPSFITEAWMVCYYGSWAVYRNGDGKFDVEHIDPTICTHAVFGFAGLAYNNELKVKKDGKLHQCVN